MRVTQAGQITIPRALRDRHGLLPGTEVQFVETGEGLTLRRADCGGHPVDRVAGAVPPSLDVDAYIEAVRGR